MGIYNSRMEMPENCFECPFRSKTEGWKRIKGIDYKYDIYTCWHVPEAVIESGKDTMDYIQAKEGRKYYCPLKEM